MHFRYVTVYSTRSAWMGMAPHRLPGVPSRAVPLCRASYDDLILEAVSFLGSSAQDCSAPTIAKFLQVSWPKITRPPYQCCVAPYKATLCSRLLLIPYLSSFALENLSSSEALFTVAGTTLFLSNSGPRVFGPLLPAGACRQVVGALCGGALGAPAVCPVHEPCRRGMRSPWTSCACASSAWLSWPHRRGSRRYHSKSYRTQHIPTPSCPSSPHQRISPTLREGSLFGSRLGPPLCVGPPLRLCVPVVSVPA